MTGGQCALAIVDGAEAAQGQTVIALDAALTVIQRSRFDCHLLTQQFAGTVIQLTVHAEVQIRTGTQLASLVVQAGAADLQGCRGNQATGVIQCLGDSQGQGLLAE